MQCLWFIIEHCTLLIPVYILRILRLLGGIFGAYLTLLWKLSLVQFTFCTPGIPRSGLCGLLLPRCAFGPHNIQVTVSDGKLNCLREKGDYLLLYNTPPVSRHIPVCGIFSLFWGNWESKETMVHSMKIKESTMHWSDSIKCQIWAGNAQTKGWSAFGVHECKLWWIIWQSFGQNLIEQALGRLPLGNSTFAAWIQAALACLGNLRLEYLTTCCKLPPTD